MPTRKSFKVAAGVGDAVYFVKGVRKISNSAVVRSWMPLSFNPPARQARDAADLRRSRRSADHRIPVHCPASGRP